VRAHLCNVCVHVCYVLMRELMCLYVSLGVCLCALVLGVHGVLLVSAFCMHCFVWYNECKWAYVRLFVH